MRINTDGMVYLGTSATLQNQSCHAGDRGLPFIFEIYLPAEGAFRLFELAFRKLPWWMGVDDTKRG